MKSNKYLTIGLLTGFIVGGCIGVLACVFVNKKVLQKGVKKVSTFNTQ